MVFIIMLHIRMLIIFNILMYMTEVANGKTKTMHDILRITFTQREKGE